MREGNKVAFTLAEVLITLTIIGVIAALTIPNLMQKWEDAQTVSGVKEAYSVLNNAIKLAIRENGPLEEWYTQGDWYFTQEIAKHLKYRKICQEAEFSCSGNYGFGDKNSCTYFKNLHGNPATGGYDSVDCWSSASAPPKLILNNGMIVAIKAGYRYITGSTTHEFFNNKIRVDINGPKGPNRFGYDVFFFQLSAAGLKPYNNNNNRNCNIAATTASAYQDGIACTSYIMKYGTVDYKYRDVTGEY